MSPESIEVRIWAFVVVMVTLVLVFIVGMLLYSVTFVTQPIKTMAPMDQAFAKMLNDIVVEKDRAILAYLIDVRLELHEHDNGYTLHFDFEPNSYFTNTTLTKKYHMSGNNVIEKCEGCTINWTAGSDPTKMKKKKKRNK